MLHSCPCFSVKVVSFITYLPSLSVIMKFYECLILEKVSHILFQMCK